MDGYRRTERGNEGCLSLVLGVLLGRGPGGGGELEALLVGNGRLLGLELGELFLHVLVVSGGLALLGTSSTGLLGRHCVDSKKGEVVVVRKGFGWTDGWGRKGKGRREGNTKARVFEWIRD